MPQAKGGNNDVASDLRRQAIDPKGRPMRRLVALALTIFALTGALTATATTASASGGPQPTAGCCRH